MNSLHPKAVLWDMDGTLIDQTEPIIRCYAQVIEGLGYPAPDTERIRRSMGGPMASTMELFVQPEDRDHACENFRKHFPEMMYDGLVVLPGALELICLLTKRKILQAILTNKHGETARAVSEYCGFSKYIDTCIGHTDTEWSKPDPLLTGHLLDKIGAQTKGVILIGDSPTDAKTARNAGIDFIGVSTGAHSKEELQDSGACMTVKSLNELNAQLSSCC